MKPPLRILIVDDERLARKRLRALLAAHPEVSVVGEASTISQAAALAACPGGFAPAADGNIDDFEDGNNQTNQEGGRDGYWYTAKDSNGSTFEIPAEGFTTSEGGDEGSTTAVIGLEVAPTGDPGIRIVPALRDGEELPAP